MSYHSRAPEAGRSLRCEGSRVQDRSFEGGGASRRAVAGTGPVSFLPDDLLALLRGAWHSTATFLSQPATLGSAGPSSCRVSFGALPTRMWSPCPCVPQRPGSGGQLRAVSDSTSPPLSWTAPWQAGPALTAESASQARSEGSIPFARSNRLRAGQRVASGGQGPTTRHPLVVNCYSQGGAELLDQGDRSLRSTASGGSLIRTGSSNRLNSISPAPVGSVLIARSGYEVPVAATHSSPVGARSTITG